MTKEEARPEARRRRRGVFLLPNLFTTAALFSGFYAIIKAIGGDYAAAASAVFIAMALDACDGRIARYTNTQSAFGAEYDSLSDVISFGVAPAVLMYQFFLAALGKMGWVAAFVYCAAAAVRLARFNIQSGDADRRFFIGLPSPSAAGLLAAFVWTATDLGADGARPGWLICAWLLTMAAGIAMVSSARYYSFKSVDLKSRIPYRAVALVLLAAAIIAVASDNLPEILLAALGLYFLSGVVLPLRALVRRALRRWRG